MYVFEEEKKTTKNLYLQFLKTVICDVGNPLIENVIPIENYVAIQN